MRTPTDGTRRMGWFIGALVVAGLAALALVIRFVTAPEPSLDKWDVDRAEVSEDGMSVEVFFTGGSCDEGSEARVEETASAVEITVVTELRRVRECDDQGHLRSVVAELEEPLSDRTLEDGACNHPEWGEALHCSRDGDKSATDGWQDSGVPYVERDGQHVLVRFGQGTLRVNPEGGLRKPSFAATRTSALVAIENASGDISLTEVSQRGQTKALSKRVVGIPIADPSGDIVVWSESLDVGGEVARFVAYDTVRGENVATLMTPADYSVVAVDARTALIVGTRETWQWVIGGEHGLVRLPAKVPSDTLVMDYSQAGGYLVLADQGTMVYSETGRVTQSLGQDMFGTFNAAGTLVALTGLPDPGGRQPSLVYDLEGEREIPLGIPDALDAYQFRWSPAGNLVVRTYPAGEDAARDESATYFDCAMPSGECQLLGDIADDFGEGFESSARGQLAATLGSE